jgi:hypothetical protein
MALTTISSNSKIITITEGMFTLRLADNSTPEDAPSGTKFRQRKLQAGPNEGKEVCEACADALPHNIITKAELVEGYKGQNLQLTLVDESEDSFLLQIPVGNNLFGEFVKRIPNIDREKTISFIMGKDKVKNRSFLWLQQDGESVKMAFTKDNPNGMPPWEEKVVQGQKQWDSTNQNNFLYDIAVKFCSEISDTNSGYLDEVPF